MNFIHIAGHLGRDPETRFTADGQKVITLTVATNIRRGGNDETVWWRVTLWGDRWDKMLPYLTKGKPVMVGGELSRKPEIYTDKNGTQQVSALDITAEYVKFSPFGKPDQNGQEQRQSSNPNPSTSQRPAGGFGDSSKNSFSDQRKQKAPEMAEESFQEGAEEEPLPF